ncbi:diguanylate cyclase domain-containing protein [Anaerotignum sp.]|uniref:diguanylate cyclase domain-containing protein n=1 Tax=Anaerotignum sp. TaxID=2039241 RepID=UPI0027151E24|nr:diguanylate cyclase [Anaerotignum sp.]
MFHLKNSVVKKIGFTIFLFVLFIFLLYYNFLNVQIKTYLEEQGKEQLRSESENLSAQIEGFLQKYTIIVEQAKQNQEFINIAKEIDNRDLKRKNPAYVKVSAQLANIRSLDENIAQAYIALGNADDLITNLYDFDMEPSYDLTKREWYVNTIKQNKITITAPYVDLITNKTAITIAAPLMDHNVVYGAFGLDILIEDMNKIMDRFNSEIDANVGLLYDTGLILYSPVSKDSTEIGNGYIQQVFDEELAKKVLSGKEGIIQYTKEGQEKYFAYFPVKDTNIIVYNEISRSNILTPINEFLVINLLILLLIIALLMIGLYVLRKLFSAPLITICENMENYTNDRSIQLPQEILVRQDEIGTLAKGFYYMIDEISNYILKLEEKNRELYDAKETINKERLRFETTLRSLGDGVISTDQNGKIQIMNDVAEKLTGWKSQDAYGLPFELVFHIIDENNKENALSLSRRVFENNNKEEMDENIILVKKNGEKILIEDCAAPILDDSGNITGVVIIFRDCTVKREKQAEISYLSFHDQLTGLKNRHFFDRELKILENERYLPLSLALIDVNGLKLTNDAFGHQMGDRLLQIVANTLKTSCRKNDLVCRIGGDEFILLLPKTDKKDAERIVEWINLEIANLTYNNMIISVSIGWATKTSFEEDIMKVYAKAEEHMYRKKLMESQNMKKKTMQMIIKKLHETNQKEKIHSENVRKISKAIGEALKLDQELLQEVEMAGTWHDIGKIAIDVMLLDKPGKLTLSEFEIIKRHAETGYHILKSVDTYSNLSEYVLAHHEHWDGSGYPRGLRGHEIPLVSRIILIAGAYEMMTRDTAYGRALRREEVINELMRCSGKQFDPSITKVFVDILKKQP